MPDLDRKSPPESGKLFVFSAASGAGKSSLKDRLVRRFPDLRYSVSATTRKPRPGEHEGQHYFFKTPEEFRHMLDAGELVEWMEVHGNWYGTPRASVEASLQSGHSVILDLDVYGKVNFDKAFPKAIGILILPPSLEELERRLIGRAQDDLDTIHLRVHNAVREMDFAREHGKYEYQIVNDNFEHALSELTAVFTTELNLTPLPD
jgi:guanylate kinase